LVEVEERLVSTAREEILRRIRRAIYDVPKEERPEDIPVERGYRKEDDVPSEEMIEHFAENVAEYEAAVHRVSEADLKEAITEACRRRGARRLVVPPGLPEGWVPDGVEALRDDTGTQLTKEELDKSDGVLTGCALGIAQTGRDRAGGRSRSCPTTTFAWCGRNRSWASFPRPSRG
jgi:L-lactate dehydrogenase complex protein LldG